MFYSPFIDKKEDDAKETFMIKSGTCNFHCLTTTIMPKLNDSFSFTTTRAEDLWSLRPAHVKQSLTLDAKPVM